MSALEPFGARLRRAMDERGPLCVGIDPHASLLADVGPERRRRGPGAVHAGRSWRRSPSRSPSSSRSRAFFERFGSRGIAVLERAVADAAGGRARWSLMDAKRGDIGSTMAAYAEAFLRKDAPLFSDALTVSPYLGFGSLQPGAWTLARASGAGLFVLALTSNPEGAEVQHAAVREDGRDRRRDHAGAPGGRERRGRTPLGSFGAVVGATLGDLSARVDLDDQRPAAGARHRRPGRDRRPTCRRSSARRCATSCRASAGGSCGTVRTPPRCVERGGSRTRSARPSTRRVIRGAAIRARD